LQAHYRSTLDFSNEALLAAAKGYKKLMNGLRVLNEIEFVADKDVDVDPKQVEQINQMAQNCYMALNDDLNTAKVVAHLFNLLKKINSMQTGQSNPSTIGRETFDLLAKTYRTFVIEIFGVWVPAPPPLWIIRLSDFANCLSHCHAFFKSLFCA
jgi:cysteinyl-tRNA synthetase